MSKYSISNVSDILHIDGSNTKLAFTLTKFVHIETTGLRLSLIYRLSIYRLGHFIIGQHEQIQ